MTWQDLSDFYCERLELVFDAWISWNVVFYLSTWIASTLILPDITGRFFMLSELDEHADAVDDVVAEAGAHSALIDGWRED